MATAGTVPINVAPVLSSGLRGWIYVICEAILPLFIVIVATLLFVLVPQASEAMFGTVGPSYAPDEAGRGWYLWHVVRPQLISLCGAIAALSLMVWYTARLLVSLDMAARLPATATARLTVQSVAGAATVLPRLLGGLCAAGLIAALLEAQQGSVPMRPLFAALATLVPFFAAVLVHAWPPRASIAIAGMVTSMVVSGLCVVALQPTLADHALTIGLVALCWMPAGLYWFMVYRRTWLTRRHARRPTPTPAAVFRGALIRLVAMMLLSSAVVLVLAVSPVTWARTLGSSAIVLLFLSGALGQLTVLALLLRRWSLATPGIVAVGGMLLIATYLAAHLALRWSPFAEQLGHERLDDGPAAPLSTPQAGAVAPDIVVNAYGGGLRAGVFTAQVMAELDDRSCGQFGARILRLSGVSGGSLGLAVYMTMRQEFVANGGWTDCVPSSTTVPTPSLRALVEHALIQDHLSPAVARMLSFDLVPWLAPRRGQALLDSWQAAV